VLGLNYMAKSSHTERRSDSLAVGGTSHFHSGAPKKKDLYQTPGRTTGVLRAPFTTRNPAAPGRLLAKTTLHSQTLHKISPKFPQEKTVWSGNRTHNLLMGRGLTRSPLSHWRRQVCSGFPVRAAICSGPNGWPGWRFNQRPRQWGRVARGAGLGCGLGHVWGEIRNGMLLGNPLG
jgi:hypothetical protein